GLQRLLQEWGEYKQAPNPIDDARNSGEQFDRNADRPAQPLRTKLGQEERDHQADRYREQHGDEGRNHGAVDRGQGAEDFGHRIPALADKKTEAERFQRRYRASDQRNDDRTQQDQDTYRGGARQF